VPYSYRAQGAAAGAHPRPAGRRRPIKGHVLLDDRTQRRLRRIRWRRIGVVLGIVALVAAAVALYLSPLLRVQDVQVVGTASVDAGQVAELAGLSGHSMLNLPKGEAEARIEALPLVRAVAIERHWPQTVRIQVMERLPWGYWRLSDKTYVVDAEGVVLPGVQPASGAPVINDLGGPVNLVPGDRVDVDAVALAQSMLQRVPQTLALGITGLEYTPQSGLSLITEAGYRVVLGDSQNADYKLAVWQAVEKQMGREAMSGHVLDLRFEDRPSFQ